MAGFELENQVLQHDFDVREKQERFTFLMKSELILSK
jgi:hypothetical protein